MADKRIIDIFWDVVSKIHRNSDGDQIKSNKFPYITFSELPLARVRLVTDNVNTKFKELTTAMTFSVSLDFDFDSSTDLMLKTQDADINLPGTFPSGADPVIANGELSIPLNANTTRFDAVLSTFNEKRNTKLEILGFNPAGELTFATQMPFRALNIQDDGAGTDPVELSTNLFFEEIAGTPSGKCVQIVNSDQVVLEKFCPPGVTC